MAYPVPKLNVLASASIVSIPGTQLAANANISNAQIAPSLGRSLSGGQSVLTINLINPALEPVGQRTNQLDLRLAKVFHFWGQSRTTIGADLYNALNSNAVQTYNTTFNANIPSGQPGGWLQPTSILYGRLFKVSVTHDF